MATAKERKHKPKRSGKQRASAVRFIRTDRIGIVLSQPLEAKSHPWLLSIGLAKMSDSDELQVAAQCPMHPRFSSKAAACRAAVALAMAYESDGWNDTAFFVNGSQLTFAKVCTIGGL